jgi:hypothetical protein
MRTDAKFRGQLAHEGREGRVGCIHTVTVADMCTLTALQFADSTGLVNHLL